MPSTYTTNLGIEKPATGEQSGTWGDTVNLNYDLFDQAINGVQSVTLPAAGSSGSPKVLAITDGTVSDGRNKFIEFVDGGDLGATAYVQLTPNDAEKVVHIRNSLSGNRAVIVFQGTYNASNDFEIPNGKDVVLKFDGAGSGAVVEDVFVDLQATALTTPSLTATGGTLDGVVIGGSTPAAGTFTDVAGDTGTFTQSGGTNSGQIVSILGTADRGIQVTGVDEVRTPVLWARRTNLSPSPQFNVTADGWEWGEGSSVDASPAMALDTGAGTLTISGSLSSSGSVIGSAGHFSSSGTTSVANATWTTVRTFSSGDIEQGIFSVEIQSGDTGAVVAYNKLYDGGSDYTSETVLDSRGTTQVRWSGLSFQVYQNVGFTLNARWKFLKTNEF